MERFNLISTFCILVWISITKVAVSTTAVPNTTISSIENDGKTTCISHEDCLYKDLFRHYNPFVRPIKDPLTTVNIGITLNIRNLRDIVEKEESMTIFGHLRCNWVDEFLKWNESDYGGVPHIIVPAEQIWLPDIAITNSISEFYDITYKRDFRVLIRSNGAVRWSFGGIFTTTCDIDLRHYPFDVQTCPLIVENWRYNKNDVDLFFNDGDPVDTRTLEPSSVFYYEGSESERLFQGGEYSTLKFSLIWRRKTLYYYINIVTPIVLMIFVALGIFWLPADCGEKMSLAITIVLAFSVFQIIVMDNTPVNSDVVPQMTSLVILVSILATTSLLTSMVVVCISSKIPSKRPPAWLRNICFNYLAKVFCMKSDLPEEDAALQIDKDIQYQSGQQSLDKMKKTDNSGESITAFSSDANNLNNKTQATNIDVQQLESILHQLVQLRKMLQDKDASSFIQDEWKFVGKVVDRCMFWIVFILFLCSFLYLILH